MMTIDEQPDASITDIRYFSQRHGRLHIGLN
jgi:hypothetical protein